MNFVCRRSSLAALSLAGVLAGLAACSTVNDALQGDKVDYRTAGSKSVTLDVPPDLTQLSRDSRYTPSGGTISASALQTPAGAAQPSVPAAAASGPGSVAPSQVGDVHVERAGTERWLATNQTPEQLWPQLEAFWQERGFTLETAQRETGLMETNWSENRAKVPQDIIRSTIGKVLDGLWDSGLRDRYRTRIERAPGGGSEIYITHQGMAEVYDSERKDTTRWQVRPPDPDLEAVMLSRLMIRLGGAEEQGRPAAEAALAKANTELKQPGTPHARLLTGAPGAGLEVDDGFDRAWRRVGLALDRNGFTVEDRDRAQGLYFVRYVDPAVAAKGEPGFFSRLFGSDKANAQGGLARYRIAVKGQANGTSTLVTVLNGQGAPETGDAAQRMLQLLVNELK